MIIKLNKFGQILNGRPAGKEAWLVAQAYTLSDKKPDEKIEVDFTGVQVLTPSWADEFLTQLKKSYPGDVILMPSDNPTVKAALEVIEEDQTVAELNRSHDELVAGSAKKLNSLKDLR